MGQTEMTTRTFRIDVAQHKTTGLLMAFSRDLKGLLVPGHSEEELAQRLPDAIREILEAQGNTVVSVRAERDPAIPSEFIASSFMANAALRRPVA